MSSDQENRRFKVGDKVKPRPGGHFERLRWQVRDQAGEVVAAEDLTSYADGYRVRIQWPDEDQPTILLDANQFDPA